MTANYFEVDEEVLSLARRIINDHHDHLLDFNVGFIFRSEGQRQNGRLVLGKAEKVSEKHKTQMDIDFLIWLAHDVWVLLDSNQKKALIDHELCHCTIRDGSPAMRGHDIEEFAEIIARYGLWSSTLREARPALEEAIQMTLPLSGRVEEWRKGGVKAVKPDIVPVE